MCAETSGCVRLCAAYVCVWVIMGAYMHASAGVQLYNACFIISGDGRGRGVGGGGGGGVGGGGRLGGGGLHGE